MSCVIFLMVSHSFWCIFSSNGVQSIFFVFHGAFLPHNRYLTWSLFPDFKRRLGSDEVFLAAYYSSSCFFHMFLKMWPLGLTLMARTRENWWANQPYNYPGPEPWLWIGPPDSHPTHDPLECVKGPDPQTQSFRISATQDNNRIAKRSPSEGSASIV